MLTLTNVTGEPCPASVVVCAGGRAVLPCVDVPSCGSLMLWLDVELGGAVVAWCTSEMTPLNRKRTRVELRGYPGTEGEIAFRSRTKAAVNGRPLRLRKVKDLYVGRYAHDMEPSILQIG